MRVIEYQLLQSVRSVWFDLWVCKTAWSGYGHKNHPYVAQPQIIIINVYSIVGCERHGSWL